MNSKQSNDNIPSHARFGAVRKHDIHTGIDIYLPYGTKVYPIEDGVVVNVEWFTGTKSNPPTPWWKDTQAVWVQSSNSNKLVFVYGEIDTDIAIGTKVSVNDCIGTIAEVLKKDKGKNPTTMLHLELYSDIPEQTVIWNIGEPMPNLLMDPTVYISKIKR